MSGSLLRFNRLSNVPFEMEYAYAGEWNLVIVKPIQIHSVVIYLVQFPGNERDSMALVYNSKDEWSNIEKESTGETESIGLAIEKFYSTRSLLSTRSHVLN
jgi:hypothetical protein